MEVKVIAATVFAAPGGSVIFPVTFDPEWLDVCVVGAGIGVGGWLWARWRHA